MPHDMTIGFRSSWCWQSMSQPVDGCMNNWKVECFVHRNSPTSSQLLDALFSSTSGWFMMVLNLQKSEDTPEAPFHALFHSWMVDVQFEFDYWAIRIRAVLGLGVRSGPDVMLPWLVHFLQKPSQRSDVAGCWEGAIRSGVAERYPSCAILSTRGSGDRSYCYKY